MSSESQIRDLLSVLRNAPLAASVGWRHLGWGRWHAALISTRALPPTARRRVVDYLRRRRPSASAAAALAAVGDRDLALQILDNAANGTRPARLNSLVAAAVALDAPRKAAGLLQRLPTDDPQRPRLEALVAARTGHLKRAKQSADRAGWRAARLRNRLTGELRALSTRPGTLSQQTPRRQGVNRRTVLHLVTNALPDVTAGYTVRTQGIAAAQRRLGLDARVVTRLGFPVTAGHLSATRLVYVNGVPIHRNLPVRWLPATDDRILELDVDETARLVERLEPAVLHAHSKYVNAQVALALRDRYGLPVVYEVRGFLEETWRSRGHDPNTDAYQLARDTETYCMAAADAVVTLSGSMRMEIIARGIDADRVVIVPNAVDDSFLKEPPGANRFRRRLGINPDEVVIGAVTTVNDYEGLDTLIDAMAKLRDRGSAARLLVVGAGPALSALRRRANDHGLADTVHFTGAVPFAAIHQHYAAIDVFVVPRDDTPVTRLVPPLKPLEAMATGRPVVASDLPPLLEIIDPQHTGAIARAGDADSFVAAIEPLLSDPAERSRIGGAARRWVAEHRTWATAARTYYELYQALGH